MQLRLDPTTPVPPFEQIRAQVALHVAAGRLRPGARLPTIRALASRLEVAPNTVARAYRELTSSGICESFGKRGTFVSEAPPVAHDIASRSEELNGAADRFAAVVTQLDVGIDDALEAVIAALRTAGAASRRTADLS